MTLLVPIMLYGWIPLSIIFFFRMPPRKAVLFSVIGGVLFLPMAKYKIPLLHYFDKTSAIALGIYLGGILSSQRRKYPINIGSYDLPIVIWCLLSPMITSLTNGLGFADGIYNIIGNSIKWGIFYWAGRRYFRDKDALREITIAIIIGGLIYVPLILFELRMSPQLSNIFYGFFPHSWRQHVRYGGYRPIVFMQHGLMVSLWMNSAFIMSFWLWKNKAIKKLNGISISIISIGLLVITIFTKSANAWSFILIGLLTWYIYNKTKSTQFLIFLLLINPEHLKVQLLYFYYQQQEVHQFFSPALFSLLH